MGLDGSKGEKIRSAIEQFGKNLKRDIATSSPFDKTKNGFVTKVTPIGYTVRIENKEYPNVQAIEGATIRVGDVVVCQSPNNQMSQMYIVGKKVNLTSGTGGGGGGDLTDVTLNGISVVSEGVARLIADTTPTSGSSNLITSGGVYNATFAKVYRSLADLSSSLTTTSTLAEICNAFDTNGSVAIFQPNMNANLAPSGASSSVGTTMIYCSTPNRIVVEFTANTGERWLCGYHKDSATLYPWKKVAKTDDLSDYVTLATDQTISGKKTFTNTVQFGDVSDGTHTDSFGNILADGEDITGKTIDLNDLNLSSGFPYHRRYICKTTGGSTNISNKPMADNAFILDVELVRWASASDYVSKQTLWSVYNYDVLWIRTCQNGTWGSWFANPYRRMIPICATGGATQAKIVNQPNYTLRNGNMISVYFLAANTAANPTLNINGTGAKPIYVDNVAATASNLTAGWHTFYYNGTNYYTGTVFDSFTVGFSYGTGQMRQNVNILAGEAITSNRLIYAKEDNKYYTIGASATINILQPILYANSSINSGATGSNNWTVRNQSSANMLGNGSAVTLTAYAPVFLKGVLTGHTLTLPSSNWWTQTIPTSADGFQYMLLGYAYTTSNVRLYSEHPIYAYIGNAFIPYRDDSTVNVSTVSNVYPTSSATASTINVLSEKAVYDGVAERVIMCDTAGGTATKEITVPSYTEREGNMLYVYLKYDNTAYPAQLQVNGGNARTIYLDNNSLNSSTATNLKAGWHLFYFYNNRYYTGHSLPVWNTMSTQYNRYTRFEVPVQASAYGITKGKLIVGGYQYSDLIAGSSIDIVYPILYAGSNISANQTGTNNYSSVPALNIASVLDSGTHYAYDSLFIKGVLNGHRFSVASSNWVTSRIPTSEDGFQYLYIGYCQTDTTFRLSETHPIYEYKNGVFAELSITRTSLPNFTRIKQYNQQFDSTTFSVGRYEFLVYMPFGGDPNDSCEFHATMTVETEDAFLCGSVSTPLIYNYSSSVQYPIFIRRIASKQLRLYDANGTDQYGQPIAVYYRKLS